MYDFIFVFPNAMNGKSGFSFLFLYHINKTKITQILHFGPMIKIKNCMPSETGPGRKLTIKSTKLKFMIKDLYVYISPHCCRHTA